MAFLEPRQPQKSPNGARNSSAFYLEKKLQGARPAWVRCLERIFEQAPDHTLLARAARLNDASCLNTQPGLNTGSFLFLFEDLSDYSCTKTHLKSCWLRKSPQQPMPPSSPLPPVDLGLSSPGDLPSRASHLWVPRSAPAQGVGGSGMDRLRGDSWALLPDRATSVTGRKRSLWS